MKLTLEERFNLSRYSRKLPCTLALRMAINDFLAQIEITSDELKQYNVIIDQNSFDCNDPNYTVSYESFPVPVIESMRHYVKVVDNEKNTDNVMLQKIIESFKKLV